MESNREVNVQTPVMKAAHAKAEDIRFNPGRRPEIKYRDLLVEEATGGQMRAEVMHLSPGAPMRATGWHYHTCEIQFLYMMKGWVDLEVDGLGTVRLQEGESLVIPGGTVHQELATSESMELLEVSVPAAISTVSCDPPVANSAPR